MRPRKAHLKEDSFKYRVISLRLDERQRINTGIFLYCEEESLLSLPSARNIFSVFRIEKRDSLSRELDMVYDICMEGFKTKEEVCLPGFFSIGEEKTLHRSQGSFDPEQTVKELSKTLVPVNAFHP